MKKPLILLAVLALTSMAMAQNTTPLTCTSSILNTAGHTIGDVKFTQTPQGVLVQANAVNIATGWHGFHIHAVGKCETPDFKSAGGHFNPHGADHGFHSEKGPHAGDMPNVYVSADGKLTTEFLAKDVSLDPNAPNTLLDADGSSLMIHAAKDDYISQPAGDAGSRIACAVLRSF